MKGTIFYIPIDTATSPINGGVICDNWWAVHPEKGVAFYAQLSGYLRSEEPSPQCNGCETTAKLLTEKLYPDCESKQIKTVFMGHAIREMNRLRREETAKPK
jgi:hypothetical protein